MPKGRPTEGKWVKHKVNILNQRNCYIYKRPRSSIWQYYLQVDGEGQQRKSTGVEGDNDDIKVQTRMNDSQWARENLSLRHNRNRSMYFEADSNSSQQSKDVMNQVLDRLVIYGYETSADIAKMQPWQLRVLKKEIPQIDFIFMMKKRMKKLKI